MSTREPVAVSRSPGAHGMIQNMGCRSGSTAVLTDATSNTGGCAPAAAARNRKSETSLVNSNPLPDWTPPGGDWFRSEADQPLDLDKAGRAARTHERTEQAGRRPYRCDARAELRVRDVVHRLVEVRVVEDVVSLRAERESDMLPDGDVLHQRHVGVEEVRA